MSGQNNIEIKAKIPVSMEETRAIAQRLAGPEYKSIILNQSDTFFNAPLCRLKLRQEKNANSTELISYERPDNVDGPKRSHFIKTAISNHDQMYDVLKMALGVKGQVVKKRELFLVEQNGLKARIHLDTVQGLGEFIEFEVMISDLSQVAEGEAMAKYLTNEFQLKDLLSGSYMDKILGQGN